MWGKKSREKKKKELKTSSDLREEELFSTSWLQMTSSSSFCRGLDHHIRYTENKAIFVDPDIFCCLPITLHFLYVTFCYCFTKLETPVFLRTLQFNNLGPG